MHPISRSGVILALVATSACADGSASRARDPVTPPLAAAAGRQIRLDDQCDPTTFNAALGAGACSATSGGVTFDRFISLLTATGSAGAWHLTPPMLDVSEGATLPVFNAGGEDHTYTEVEEFGGGIVPQLNQLSGQTMVAPECTQLHAQDFIHAGQSVPHTFDEAGEEKYQCCIHPWMRQVVHVRGES